MIERIEVIHGANALQGLGASGGIINIITKRAPRKDGETFHDVSVSASVAVPREDDSAGYKASYVFGTRRGDVDFVGGASLASEGLYYDGDGRAIAVNDVQGDLMDARSHNSATRRSLERPRSSAARSRTFGQSGGSAEISVSPNCCSGLPRDRVSSSRKAGSYSRSGPHGASSETGDSSAEGSIIGSPVLHRNAGTKHSARSHTTNEPPSISK